MVVVVVDVVVTTVVEAAVVFGGDLEEEPISCWIQETKEETLA